jgi:hypothetical protein
MATKCDALHTLDVKRHITAEALKRREWLL